MGDSRRNASPFVFMRYHVRHEARAQNLKPADTPSRPAFSQLISPRSFLGFSPFFLTLFFFHLPSLSARGCAFSTRTTSVPLDFRLASLTVNDPFDYHVPSACFTPFVTRPGGSCALRVRSPPLHSPCDRTLSHFC